MELNGNGHHDPHTEAPQNASLDAYVADVMASADSGPGLAATADPLDEERTRLEAELAQAKERLLAAQHRAAKLDAEAKAALRAELAASRDVLAAMERDHAQALTAVRADADAEVERILATAREQAERIRADVIDDEGGTDG